jgi:hypothetical protein
MIAPNEAEKLASNAIENATKRSEKTIPDAALVVLLARVPTRVEHLESRTGAGGSRLRVPDLQPLRRAIGDGAGGGRWVSKPKSS